MANDLQEAQKRRQKANRAYYARNVEKIRAAARVKAREAYASSPELRERALIASKAYRQANPERAKAARKALYEKNKSAVRAQSKEWYALNKERHSSRRAQWRLENKGTDAAYCRKYQAAKKNAVPAWADTEFEVFAVAEAYSIAAARSEMVGVLFEVDHIVPLRGRTVCGLHCIANLSVVPRSVNASKGNRLWPDMPT